MLLNRSRPLRWFASVFLSLWCAAASAQFTIEADVIYGRKDGMALTYDVLRPDNANGAAIIFMMSGGWYSSWSPPERVALQFADLLEAGFTVIPLYHGSAPRYKIPDAVNDVNLATMHIKSHAADYGLDPDRIGVTGGSAGGHLALMVGLATEQVQASAAAGDDAPDASLAAIVAYFPPVDFRQEETAAAGIVSEVSQEELYSRFPALIFDEALIPAVSPITHVDSDDPPTLLVHGDADPLVHISHSVAMSEALKASNIESDFVVIEGGKHGFRGENSAIANRARLAWFEQYLLD
jgi:acetyl esterase/lipase